MSKFNVFKYGALLGLASSRDICFFNGSFFIIQLMLVLPMYSRWRISIFHNFVVTRTTIRMANGGTMNQYFLLLCLGLRRKTGWRKIYLKIVLLHGNLFFFWQCPHRGSLYLQSDTKNDISSGMRWTFHLVRYSCSLILPVFVLLGYQFVFSSRFSCSRSRSRPSLLYFSSSCTLPAGFCRSFIIACLLNQLSLLVLSSFSFAALPVLQFVVIFIPELWVFFCLISNKPVYHVVTSLASFAKNKHVYLAGKITKREKIKGFSTK